MKEVFTNIYYWWITAVIAGVAADYFKTIIKKQLENKYSKISSYFTKLSQERIEKKNYILNSIKTDQTALTLYLSAEGKYRVRSTQNLVTSLISLVIALNMYDDLITDINNTFKLCFFIISFITSLITIITAAADNFSAMKIKSDINSAFPELTKFNIK